MPFAEAGVEPPGMKWKELCTVFIERKHPSKCKYEEVLSLIQIVKKKLFGIIQKVRLKIRGLQTRYLI